MQFPYNYNALNKNTFELNKFSLIPIRFEHRNEILLWRNEQLYHLRQKKKLNVNEQEIYFQNEIKPLFKLKNPNQILFSFLFENNLVGYGGLVHINWEKKNAELSFLIKTELDKKYFKKYWGIYISLIEKVAFEECGLKSIYTYSFELRPKLYEVLRENNFLLKKTIKNAKQFKGKHINALIHEKLNLELFFRHVSLKDMKFIYELNNGKTARENSLSDKEITIKEHETWFKKNLQNKDLIFYIFYTKNKSGEEKPIGSVRLSKIKQFLKISIVVSPLERGNGFGKRMVSMIINQHPSSLFIAEVLKKNIASRKIFKANLFEFKKEIQRNNKKIIIYSRNA